jgi:hypothetical protein
MVKRTMNGKRLLLLAAFAAFASFAMPAAFAGSLSNTVPITVKWNTQAVGSLILHTNYDATGAQQLTAPSILTNNNGGAGTCTAAGVGSEAAATVNFGNVSADGTKFTNCQYKNAFIAIITTSDPLGYTLGVSAVAIPAGYQLCAIPNGAWANNMAVTQSSAVAATSIIATNACPAAPSGVGKTNMDTTGNANLFTGGASTLGTNLGADVNLVIPNNASIVNNSTVENFTLTVN